MAVETAGLIRWEVSRKIIHTDTTTKGKIIKTAKTQILHHPPNPSKTPSLNQHEQTDTRFPEPELPHLELDTASPAPQSNCTRTAGESQ
jgi:hypothetical protein